MEKYDSIPSLGEQQRSSRVFTCLVVFAEVLALAVVIMISVWMGNFRGGFAWHDNVAKEFNYHPLFMTLGLVFLQGNALLVYRVFRSERKMRLKIAHSVLQALALIISAVGLKAVFDSHNLAAAPHANMYTLHSWIGLATIILFGIQWLVGFISFLLPFCRQSLRAFILPIHTFFGVVIFCFAVATAMMGITEKLIWTLRDKYSAFVSEGVMVNTAGVLLVTMAVTVVFIVTNPNYKRQPLPDEENIPLTN